MLGTLGAKDPFFSASNTDYSVIKGRLRSPFNLMQKSGLISTDRSSGMIPNFRVRSRQRPYQVRFHSWRSQYLTFTYDSFEIQIARGAGRTGCHCEGMEGDNRCSLQCALAYAAFRLNLNRPRHSRINCFLWSMLFITMLILTLVSIQVVPNNAQLMRSPLSPPTIGQ